MNEGLTTAPKNLETILSDDLLFAGGLVFLINIYMYPNLRTWTTTARIIGTIIGILIVHRVVFRRRPMVLPPIDAYADKTRRGGSSTLSTTVCEAWQPTTPEGRAVALTNPYSVSAPNVRNAFLAVPGQGCQASGSYGSAAVLPAAQFCASPPEPPSGVTDPAFQPAVPPSQSYRDLSNYSSPGFVLQNPSDPATWIPRETSESSAGVLSPIPADQPKFYCQFNPDCDFQPLGQQWVSQNQTLVGNANSKTLVPPRIPTRLYDVDEWADDPFVVLPGINQQYDQELAQSGYLTTPGNESMCRRQPPPNSTTAAPSTAVQEDFRPSASFEMGVGQQQTNGSGSTKIPIDRIENENLGRLSLQAYKDQWTLDHTIDTSQGYYPENTRYNVPVNVPYQPSPDTQCQNTLDEYNRRIGTIPLQPGISTFSQVNQTDSMMSNLGISFTQPLLPTIPNRESGGDGIVYTEYDPLQIPRRELERQRHAASGEPGETPRIEIYDPRLTGYGTSYRTYIDEMTGQPRFYYDDIEATTQYNYISRNNIDFMPYGMQPGPAIASQVCDWPSAMDVRQHANDTFVNDTLFQRMDLQERLMRKNSHRERQRRSAPIHTMNTARC